MQAEAVKATQRRTVWNVLRRNLSLTAGCLILLCVVFTALFPGLIASQSPTDQNLTAMLAAPSAEHIWGTDELGRDIFARVIWGTRYDLVIGLAAASVPFIVGTLIGLFTAYFGGILDTLFMRLVDVMMSFPVIVLIIAIVAVLVGLRLFWQPQILLQVVELHLRSPLRLLLVLLAAAAGGWFVFFFEKGKSSNRNRGNR